MTFQGFDHTAARQSGYSDDEIIEYLKSQRDFDVKGARKSGYSKQEIIDFLSQPGELEESQEPQAPSPEERSFGEKAARVGGQFGLGIVEGATFPAEAYLASATSQGNQATNIRNEIVKDMEWLAEKKMFGTATPEDEAKLQELQELYQNPDAINEITTDYGDLSVRRGVEKVTGIDMKPEGFVEEAANIAGFIKNPAKIAKAGLNPKSLFKAIAPTGKEMLRASAMEAGLEYARDGDFGPVGQIGMMVLGDIAAEKGVGLVKAAVSPKKTIASLAAKRANKAEAKELVSQLRESGIQADLGTITDSDLIKMIQAKLDQSGLTGDALDNLRKNIFNDIKEEYRQVADGVNEYKFQNQFDAGTVMKNTLEEVRDQDLSKIRTLYEDARQKVSGKQVSTSRLNNLVETIESDLSLGAVKSTEQQSVLNILDKIKSDIQTSDGVYKAAPPQVLMNDKIALNDIINYEAQGGTKRLLRNIVSEIDKSLKRYGKLYDKEFLKNYTKANQGFAEHAKTFRNKSIANILKEQTPERVLKTMDTIDGIGKIEKALSKTPEGRFLYEALKRNKLDDIFSKSMVNSMENQLKIGQFKNIFENSKNEQLIRRLLQPQDFKRLRNLARNADSIQKAGAKFMNPSKSGVVIQDVAVIGKLIADLGHIFYGNFFPFIRTAGGISGSRYLTNLMGDPEFLKIVEDMILAESKNDIAKMIEIGEKLRPYANEYISQDQTQD